VFVGCCCLDCICDVVLFGFVCVVVCVWWWCGVCCSMCLVGWLVFSFGCL